MEHKLQVKSVTHSFGEKSILSQCSLECKTGEIIGILGRNGSGKSTLFKILFGTLKPDHFEAYLENKRWEKNTDPATVGYHPQEVMLPKRLRVRSLISMYITSQGNQDKVFYTPGINDMLNKEVGILSIGQQRYLQLILLLNLNHHFLLLDEPFSMVEPLYRELIKEKLIEYKSSKGFIITDHYYLDVLEITDKINLIKDAQIIPIASIEELRMLEYLSDQSIVY
ncbi:MAG: ATP-binding cassette domain-containing protein [Bacteroidota bacterium]|nr:ATP-binding cassette domain-containing protein [Bacteroidota bacterium]